MRTIRKSHANYCMNFNIKSIYNIFTLDKSLDFRLFDYKMRSKWKTREKVDSGIRHKDGMMDMESATRAYCTV